MEKAKDANIIGILVGTLGVGMYIANLNIKNDCIIALPLPH